MIVALPGLFPYVIFDHFILDAVLWKSNNTWRRYQVGTNQIIHNDFYIHIMLKLIIFTISGAINLVCLIQYG